MQLRLYIVVLGPLLEMAPIFSSVCVGRLIKLHRPVMRVWVPVISAVKVTEVYGTQLVVKGCMMGVPSENRLMYLSLLDNRLSPRSRHSALA